MSGLNIKNNKKVALFTLAFFAVGGTVYAFLPAVFSTEYDSKMQATPSVAVTENQEIVDEEPVKEEPKLVEVTHLKTPEEVKGIYISNWAAGTPSFITRLKKMVDETELNTVIIDVKDSSGVISFEPVNPELHAYGSWENRIRNIRGLTNDLHAEGVYIIARVAVFQDSKFIKNHPEIAVKKASDKDSVWKDRKGLAWIDAGSKEAWEYTMLIADEAYEAGCDAINLDYIRFPSDGNLKDIYYPISEGKVKHDVIREFFEFVNKTASEKEYATSADLFGLVTTAEDDMNIGQLLEDGLNNFDFVAPMVYPSHFAKGWNGFANPAANPHDVIKISMSKAVERAKAIGVDPLKLRPWLQDFDLGATYTKEMVRAQIDATYEAGLTSWMLWDASNKYTPEALKSE